MTSWMDEKKASKIAALCSRNSDNALASMDVMQPQYIYVCMSPDAKGKNTTEEAERRESAVRNTHN